MFCCNFSPILSLKKKKDAAEILKWKCILLSRVKQQAEGLLCLYLAVIYASALVRGLFALDACA